MPGATGRTLHSEMASKFTAAFQTTVTNAVADAEAQTSVKSENTDVSANTVHMKNAMHGNAYVAPHIQKSHPTAAPHLTTATSVMSEHKNPPTELSNTPTTKIKPKENPHKVG